MVQIKHLLPVFLGRPRLGVVGGGGWLAEVEEEEEEGWLSSSTSTSLGGAECTTKGNQICTLRKHTDHDTIKTTIL